MKHQVNVSAEAKRLIEDQVRFIAVEKHEPQNAADWAASVDTAIASLDSMPERCSLAPENELTGHELTGKTIRMLRVQSHLILFSIDEDAPVVNVLSFRAGRQLPAKGLGE